MTLYRINSFVAEINKTLSTSSNWKVICFQPWNLIKCFKFHCSSAVLINNICCRTARTGRKSLKSCQWRRRRGRCRCSRWTRGRAPRRAWPAASRTLPSPTSSARSRSRRPYSSSTGRRRPRSPASASRTPSRRSPPAAVGSTPSARRPRRRGRGGQAAHLLQVLGRGRGLGRGGVAHAARPARRQRDHRPAAAARGAGRGHRGLHEEVHQETQDQLLSGSRDRMIVDGCCMFECLPLAMKPS